jgi:hypothetical protein
MALLERWVVPVWDASRLSLGRGEMALLERWVVRVWDASRQSLGRIDVASLGREDVASLGRIDVASLGRMKGCEEGISEGDEDKRIVGGTVGNDKREDGRLMAVRSAIEYEDGWICSY